MVGEYSAHDNRAYRSLLGPGAVLIYWEILAKEPEVADTRVALKYYANYRPPIFMHAKKQVKGACLC